MLSLWQRLPVIVRAVIAGTAVSTAGVVPWTALVRANQKFLLGVPWAAAAMALYLWLFWRYLRGEGWPRTTAEARRTSLRANGLSGDTWGLALFAGMVGFTALFPLLGLMARVVRLPAESQPIRVPPQMPFMTVFVLLVMGAIVAGVVEEAAFRGYMQGPVERRHGPLIAILASGAYFGLGHFTHHPDSVLAMMPYYLAVAGIYGGLAYATNSILPGLILHAGGDVLVLNRLWMTGQSEWQVSSKAPELIWQTGTDAAFWAYLVAFVVAGGATFWLMRQLATLVQNEQASTLRLNSIRQAL